MNAYICGRSRLWIVFAGSCHVVSEQYRFPRRENAVCAHMISALISVTRPSEPDAIDRLADTLGSLVAGVAAGLVGDAVIVVPSPNAAIETVAEATGAKVVLRVGARRPGPPAPRWPAGTGSCASRPATSRRKGGSASSTDSSGRPVPMSPSRACDARIPACPRGLRHGARPSSAPTRPERAICCVGSACSVGRSSRGASRCVACPRASTALNWADTFAACDPIRPDRRAPTQVFIEARHDLDEVAGAMAVVELRVQDPVPGVAAGSGRARQHEDVGGVGHPGGARDCSVEVPILS